MNPTHLRDALRAAGHDGPQQGEGLFIKPTNQQEVDFYQWLASNPGPLNQVVPLFMGTLQESQLPQTSKPASAGNSSIKDRYFIVLEDLCNGIEQPSVMDIKLGSQLYDAKASEEKKARRIAVSKSTTSGSLGFRISGMSVICDGERIAYDKVYGREATPDTIVDRLASFWPNLSNEYIFAVLESMIGLLEQLQEILTTECVEIHSASVLIVYEGNTEALKQRIEECNIQAMRQSKNETKLGEDSEEEDTGKIVDVRLIDFAHSEHTSKPDFDVLHGVSELIRCLKELKARHLTSCSR